MLINILHRSQADTDCTIFTIDGNPAAAVGDRADGYWAHIREGEYITNPYDQYIWYVEEGKWESVDYAVNRERKVTDGLEEIQVCNKHHSPIDFDL